MELFKTSILKNEYKEFSEKLLPSVLECNYCNVISCEWHSKFTGTAFIAEKDIVKIVVVLIFQKTYF